MTSSYTLKKLNENPGVYEYHLPGSTLGGIEDQYLKIQGECHPDFITTPIGNPYGAKLCTRRPPIPPAKRCGERQPPTPTGYYRGSVNLYDVYARFPQQDWNPLFYADRRTLYEGDLIERDILRPEIKYNGTGVETTRIPHELLDADQPYFSYKQSFTPREDPVTGLRTATSWNDTVVPPKYDVTRLHQPYVSWKREYDYMRHPQNDQDLKNWKRIV
jgi:hypothetical protein